MARGSGLPLVAGGRRRIAWEHAIYRDMRSRSGPEDQIDALHAAAERFGFLDLERVGIRGWSFSGYLAALAVLRRPDVFHAAVAGAPVTDQTLYDTAYTERTSEIRETIRTSIGGTA